MAARVPKEVVWFRTILPTMVNIIEIIDSDTSAGVSIIEYMTIYDSVYSILNADQSASDFMFIEIRKMLEIHANSLRADLISARDGKELLMKVAVLWNKHKLIMEIMRRGFQYLGQAGGKLDPRVKKSVVPAHPHGPVVAIGLDVFHQTIYKWTKETCCSAAIEQITNARTDKYVDTYFIGEILNLFGQVGEAVKKQGEDPDKSYREDFENDFLSASQMFYRRASENWIADYSFIEYLHIAEDRLNFEETVISRLINRVSTSEKLKIIVESELLTSRVSYLLSMDSGIEMLLTNKLYDNIRTMVNMFYRIKDGLKPIAEGVQNYVESWGDDLYSTTLASVYEKPPAQFLNILAKDYIQKVLNFFDDMQTLIAESFKKHPILQKAIADGFKPLLLKSFKRKDGSLETKTAQLLAYYVDLQLRLGGKGNYEMPNFDNVIDILLYLPADKDYFIRDLGKGMAKRLLEDFDINSEKELIGKLKLKHPDLPDLYKLTRMLNDKDSEIDMKSDYVKFCKAHPHGTHQIFDHSVLVLETNCWPAALTKETAFKPPVEFIRAQNQFKSFFDTKYADKVLTYAYGQGSVDMIYIRGKQYTITMSLHQASILLIFDSQDSISLGDIKAITGLSTPEDLGAAIIPLLTPITSSVSKRGASSVSGGILNCSEDIKQESPSRWSNSIIFTVNQEFSSPLLKFKLTKHRVSTEKESSETKSEVKEARMHEIDAVIVRIMKSRKTLIYSNLVIETINHVKDRFQPELRDIKSRIESLMDREYLHRNEDDPNIIEYVA
jgi:hypothetical protein